MLDEKFKKPYLFISILISVIIAQTLIFFYIRLESSSFKPMEDKSVVAIKLSSLDCLPSKPKEEPKEATEPKPIPKSTIEPKKEPKSLLKPKEEPKEATEPKPIPKSTIEPKKEPKSLLKPKEETESETKYEPTPKQNYQTNENFEKKESYYKEEYAAKLKSDYLLMIRKKIEKSKFYPRSAKRLKQTGVVEVEFRVEKSGKITYIKIIKPSKYKRLNRAAKKTLEKIEFFKPIPKELEYQELIIKVPIKFMLKSQ